MKKELVQNSKNTFIHNLSNCNTYYKSLPHFKVLNYHRCAVWGATTTMKYNNHLWDSAPAGHHGLAIGWFWQEGILEEGAALWWLSLVGAVTSIIFVETKVCCSKRMFVVAKHIFCRNKSMLAAPNLLWKQNISVVTKMILVAAPASDRWQHV